MELENNPQSESHNRWRYARICWDLVQWIDAPLFFIMLGMVMTIYCVHRHAEQLEDVPARILGGQIMLFGLRALWLYIPWADRLVRARHPSLCRLTLSTKKEET